MRKNRYSRNNDSLFITVIRSPWQYSAILSVGILGLTYIVVPILERKSVIIQAFIAAFKPFLLLFAGVFALISLINYFRQSKPKPNMSAQSPRFVSRPAPPAQSNAVTLHRRQDPEHQIVYGCSTESAPSVNLGVVSDANTLQRPASWSMELLQQIEWKLFEDISAAYYKEKGIRAELTKLGADGGIDIKLFHDDSNKPTALVQCKAWNTKMVGVKPIREFLGVMSHEKIQKGFFMASGSYSPDAMEIAKTNAITLIDGEMFLAMIQQLPVEAQQRLLDLATAGEYTTPSCPSCGVKMLRRSAKQGEFWGVFEFPSLPSNTPR